MEQKKESKATLDVTRDLSLNDDSSASSDCAAHNRIMADDSAPSRDCAKSADSFMSREKMTSSECGDAAIEGDCVKSSEYKGIDDVAPGECRSGRPSETNSFSDLIQCEDKNDSILDDDRRQCTSVVEHQKLSEQKSYNNVVTAGGYNNESFNQFLNICDKNFSPMKRLDESEFLDSEAATRLDGSKSLSDTVLPNSSSDNEHLSNDTNVCNLELNVSSHSSMIPCSASTLNLCQRELQVLSPSVPAGENDKNANGKDAKRCDFSDKDYEPALKFKRNGDCCSSPENCDVIERKKEIVMSANRTNGNPSTQTSGGGGRRKKSKPIRVCALLDSDLDELNNLATDDVIDNTDDVINHTDYIISNGDDKTSADELLKTSAAEDSFMCPLCGLVEQTESALTDHVRVSHLAGEDKGSPSLDEFPTKYHRLGSELQLEVEQNLKRCRGVLPPAQSSPAPGSDRTEDRMEENLSEDSKEQASEPAANRNEPVINFDLSAMFGTSPALDLVLQAARIRDSWGGGGGTETPGGTTQGGTQRSSAGGAMGCASPASFAAGLGALGLSAKADGYRQSSETDDYCDRCQKHFCNKYYLRKHKQDVHGITPGGGGEAAYQPQLSFLPPGHQQLFANHDIYSSGGLLSAPSSRTTSAGAVTANQTASFSLASIMSSLPMVLPYPGAGLGSVAGLGTTAPSLVSSSSQASINAAGLFNASSLLPGLTGATGILPCLSRMPGQFPGLTSMSGLIQPSTSVSIVPGVSTTTSGNGGGSNLLPGLTSMSSLVPRLNNMSNLVPGLTSMSSLMPGLASLMFLNPFASPLGLLKSASPFLQPGSTPSFTAQTPPNFGASSNFASASLNTLAELQYASGAAGGSGGGGGGMAVGLAAALAAGLAAGAAEAQEPGACDPRTNFLFKFDAPQGGGTGGDQGPVRCDICFKEFCSSYFVKVHKRDKHGIPLPTAADSSPSVMTSSSFGMGLNSSLNAAALKFLGLGAGDCKPAKGESAGGFPLLQVKQEAGGAYDKSDGYSSSVADGGDCCCLCKKHFANRYGLMMHLLNAHNIKPEGFGLASELLQLDKLNGGIKQNSALPGKGGLCGGGGSGGGSVTPAQSAKMSDRVSCDICNKEVCNKYFLKTHKMKVHGLDSHQAELNSGIGVRGGIGGDGGGGMRGVGLGEGMLQDGKFFTTGFDAGVKQRQDLLREDDIMRSFYTMLAENETRLKQGPAPTGGGSGQPDIKLPFPGTPSDQEGERRRHRHHPSAPPRANTDASSRLFARGADGAAIDDMMMTLGLIASHKDGGGVFGLRGRGREDGGGAGGGGGGGSGGVVNSGGFENLALSLGMQQRLADSLKLQAGLSRAAAGQPGTSRAFDDYSPNVAASSRHQPSRDAKHAEAPGGGTATLTPGAPTEEDLIKSGIDPEAFCDICQKEFCSKYFLKTHRQKIHGMRTSGGVSDAAPRGSGQDGSDLVLPGLAASSGGGMMVMGNKALLAAIMQPAESIGASEARQGGAGGEGGGGVSGGRAREGSNGGRVTCEICAKELCNKYFLRTHMMKLHGMTSAQAGVSASVGVGLGALEGTSAPAREGDVSTEVCSSGGGESAENSTTRVTFSLDDEEGNKTEVGSRGLTEFLACENMLSLNLSSCVRSQVGNIGSENENYANIAIAGGSEAIDKTLTSVAVMQSNREVPSEVRNSDEPEALQSRKPTDSEAQSIKPMLSTIQTNIPGTKVPFREMAIENTPSTGSSVAIYASDTMIGYKSTPAIEIDASQSLSKQHGRLQVSANFSADVISSILNNAKGLSAHVTTQLGKTINDGRLLAEQCILCLTTFGDKEALFLHILRDHKINPAIDSQFSPTTTSVSGLIVPYPPSSSTDSKNPAAAAAGGGQKRRRRHRSGVNREAGAPQQVECSGDSSSASVCTERKKSRKIAQILDSVDGNSVVANQTSVNPARSDSSLALGIDAGDEQGTRAGNYGDIPEIVSAKRYKRSQDSTSASEMVRCNSSLDGALASPESTPSAAAKKVISDFSAGALDLKLSRADNSAPASQESVPLDSPEALDMSASASTKSSDGMKSVGGDVSYGSSQESSACVLQPFTMRPETAAGEERYTPCKVFLPVAQSIYENHR